MKLWCDLGLEGCWVKSSLLFLDYSSDTELNVRDAVAASFDYCRDNHFGDHFPGQVAHSTTKSLKSSHPVIEALLLNVVRLDHFGDQARCNPCFAERLSQDLDLLDAHLAHGSSCVCQICVEEPFEASLE